MLTRHGMESLAFIPNHVVPASLVVFRLGGLTIYGPVFGAAVVPVRVKVLFSFILGLSVYPLLAQRGFVGQNGAALAELPAIIAVELLLGLVIGWLASLPLAAMQTGGLLIGQQIGLGFAQIFNPSIDDEADVIGQMLFFMTLASFLIIGGHEAMVLAVLNSFQLIPAGEFRVDGDLLAMLVGMLAAGIELSLRIAAPLLAIIFLESIAMGFVSKTVPQLNILSLGFPIRIMIGIGIVAIGLYIIHDVMMQYTDSVLESIMTMIGAGQPHDVTNAQGGLTSHG
jgi:flagellar biosynthetic protein FliR